LNPDWNDENSDYQSLFEKAVSLTGSEFSDCVNYIWRSWLPARDLVEKAFDQRFEVDPSGLIILLEKFCPWREHLFQIEEEKGLAPEKKPLYTLFPDSTSGSLTW